MSVSRSYVLIHKKSGQLVEYFHGFMGPTIIYGPMEDGEIITRDSPIMFDDDPRFDLDDYDFLDVLEAFDMSGHGK